ncbi:hypothetical protein LOC71_13000 [Rhodopirellula sp. JC740]|uniref:Uncharacterized protein n=1 Tax=Rhodopirellula halodulae TaxID=2894198 RepID=A0ABS8NI15_9BACT|nr:hypothetical protein [Rhodopirellula sp. JC740]MCC9643195.1 hypothetical protein [Rhodopirellula sp. JC740]
MNKRAQLALTAIAVSSALTIGCAGRHGIFGTDKCADVPAGAIPEPAGTKVCEWQTEQVQNAIADQTVYYQADFVGGTAELSPVAMERLARNSGSGLLAIQHHVIEPSGDTDLDAFRVHAVTETLLQAGVPQPVVQVAVPAALGLRGPQAERVAGGFGTIRNSSAGTGAPISRPSGLGGVGVGGFGGF